MQKREQTSLTGKKMIMAYVGRSWKIIMVWINERNFPARKIDGVWESDIDLIDKWLRSEILQR